MACIIVWQCHCNCTVCSRGMSILLHGNSENGMERHIIMKLIKHLNQSQNILYVPNLVKINESSRRSGERVFLQKKKKKKQNA